jgi:plastocyanin
MPSRQSRKIALVAMLTFASIILLAGAVYASDQGKKVDIVGADSVKINHDIQSTFRFQPGEHIHVKSGHAITLTDSTTDPHTLSVVDQSLLPVTFDDVFTCGTVPGDICQIIFGAHGLTMTSVTNLFVDDGVGSNTNPPVLNTPFTLTTGGDSVVIFPGQSITMTVNAPAGTELHFFCAIHPWMQGDIIVDK